MSPNHQIRSIIIAFLGILACLLMMPPITAHAALIDDYAPPATYHRYQCKEGPPGGLLLSGPSRSEGVAAQQPPRMDKPSSRSAYIFLRYCPPT